MSTYSVFDINHVEHRVTVTKREFTDDIRITCTLEGNDTQYISNTIITTDTKTYDQIISGIICQNNWRCMLIYNHVDNMFVMTLVNEKINKYESQYLFTFHLDENAKTKTDTKRVIESKYTQKTKYITDDTILIHTNPKYKILYVPTCCDNPFTELEKLTVKYLQRGYVPIGNHKIISAPKAISGHAHGTTSYDYLTQAIYKL